MGLILRDGVRAWRNGTLPFRINREGFTNTAINNINRAIAHWNTNTNWQIVARNRERDFVEFQIGEGCSSPVGRQGGRQFINLGTSCSLGNAIHEIGHALGFGHEQNRGDRDNYVIVMKDRVDPARLNNFNKESSSLFLDHGEYDYGSIMHYGRSGFLKNKRYDWSSGWTTSEFFEASGETYLFLLKARNGIVHLHHMVDDFVGREVERHDWSSGWTNVRFYEVNNRRFMFLLKSENGIVHIHQVDADGTVGRRVEQHNWSDDWTTSEFYTINGRTYLFLLKAKNGIVHIHQMNNNGSVGREIARHDWSNGWTNVRFYEIGGQQYMFLLKSGNGTVHIHQMNNNGTVGNRIAKHDWSNGWTSSEFYTINGRTYLFLLKERNGIVHIHQMDNDGTIGRRIQNFDWTSGWTNVRMYQTDGDLYLWLLKSGSGIVHIHHINNNGTIGDEITVNPKINIYSPRSIGQRGGLSAGDIAAANDRI